MHIVSIRHSGTRTMLHMAGMPHGTHDRRTHTKTSSMATIMGWLDKGCLLIAPYRHPCRIWQSWKGEKSRRPDCDYTIENFMDEHDNLVDLYNSGHLDIVVLDHKIGRKAIRQINKKGFDINPVVEPKGTQFNTIDILVTERMRSEIPKRYLDFYETLINA